MDVFTFKTNHAQTSRYGNNAKKHGFYAMRRDRSLSLHHRRAVKTRDVETNNREWKELTFEEPNAKTKLTKKIPHGRLLKAEL